MEPRTNDGRRRAGAVDGESNSFDGFMMSDHSISSSETSEKTNRVKVLQPLVPAHVTSLGVLNVDNQHSRVVYLAPLTSVPKEIYLQKHKTEDANDECGMHFGESNRPIPACKRRALEALERHLTTLQRLEAENERSSGLSNEQRSITSSFGNANTTNLDTFVANQQKSEESGSGSNNTSIVINSDDRDQLHKLKQKIRLLPITEQDRVAFIKKMSGYRKIQQQDRKSLLTSHTTPFGFNMEAAWNKLLLEERHATWIQSHVAHIEGNRIRKEQEDIEFERRIRESTAEYRAQMRLLRETKARLQIAAQNLLPSIMFCAFSQKILTRLQHHWNCQRLQMRLRTIIKFWCQKRSVHHTNIHAASVLIHWLRESVAVKSVGFRVFRGIRTYVWRVKKLQQVWRMKAAKRQLNFLLVERMWISQETKQVEAAIDTYDRKMIKREQKIQDQKTKKINRSSKHRPLCGPDQWMTFVEDSIRTQVINTFIREMEEDFTQRFRAQEMDLFPQLMQSLRCEHPNRARSYIKEVANRLVLLGKVHSTLRSYPDAVKDVLIIMPFDMHLAPIEELIRKGKALSLPDTTDCRQFTSKHLQTMQDDVDAQHLLSEDADEEYKKHLTVMLQKRQQLRHHAPVHPITSTEIGQGVIEQDHPQPIINSTLVPSSIIGKMHDPSRLKRNPQHSYAMIVVTYSFRYLPSFSEKTKDVATALFNSLIDANFNRFSRKGSRLLINPSVIEFQDTMKELQTLCATNASDDDQESSFFMFLSSHGARVTNGANKGSYILFSQTRLSSEEELLLTAVHEDELAQLIHAIPCRNKLIALEVCQMQEAKEKPLDEAFSIRNHIGEQFLLNLHTKLSGLQFESQNEHHEIAHNNDAPALKLREDVRDDLELLNIILLEACDSMTEVPLRNLDDGVSNFLHRFNDAFRGGAVVSPLEEVESYRRPLYAFEVINYVYQMVRKDAEKQNLRVKEEYYKQVRNKYERIAEFQEITQTTNVVGAAHAIDFGVGDIPASPELAPSTPKFLSSTLNSITLTWTFSHSEPTGSISDLPLILGYHVQYRGCGRASVSADQWKQACGFQVVTFDQASRKHRLPPTTISKYGLNSDTAYCFRVRARTAGGWGPFSETSLAFRTSSVATVMDHRSTVQLATSRGGVRELIKLMKKHSEIGSIQQLGVEELAKMVITDGSRSSKMGVNKFLAADLDLQAVLQVRDAMQKFAKNNLLQRHGSLFFGRLASSDVTWRTSLLSIHDPTILAQLDNISHRFANIDHETASCAVWAKKHLYGDPVVRYQKLSKHEAASRIQRLIRTRKAREYARTLALAVYCRLVDPTTGMQYFYNTKTGTTSWSMPSFLS